MASVCSECGALSISKEPTVLFPVTTWTLVRCQQLMQSNEPPGSAERDYIQAIASKTAARLSCLDDEISRLRTQLAHLETEREQLSKYHSQNIAILSPLRRMPAEVLAEIFSWTLPTINEMDGAQPESDVKPSPWVLTQVSCRWRQVALSTPSLWSTVYVDCGDDSVYSQPELIQLQVERARTLNLKIHFYGSEDINSRVELGLFKFLSQHSARWEELDIQLTAALVPCLAALRGRLPSLRRLWIQWDNAESQTGVNTIKCFETASSLLDVGVHNESRFIPVLFPTHQLTCYRLHAPWKAHQNVLKMAPNIVEARVWVAFDDQPWPEPGDQTIDMLHLQRLYVSDVKVLDYLRAPVLSGIALALSQQEAPLDYLDAFTMRSSCAPRRLCVIGTPAATTTAEILKKHPSITSLALTCGARSVVDAHLIMLTAVGDTLPVISPALTEICFGSTRSIPIDYPLFLKMLESRRRRQNCALGAAAFLTYAGPEPDPVTLIGLEALREGGLSLLVASGGIARDCIGRWAYECPWN